MELNLLLDGVSCNPGSWGRHCLTAAYCAEKIAGACGNMDTEKAYILGLLHDIGRKFGVRYLGHVSDRYTYMKSFWSMKKGTVCPCFRRGRVQRTVPCKTAGKYEAGTE